VLCCWPFNPPPRGLQRTRTGRAYVHSSPLSRSKIRPSHHWNGPARAMRPPPVDLDDRPGQWRHYRVGNGPRKVGRTRSATPPFHEELWKTAHPTMCMDHFHPSQGSPPTSQNPRISIGAPRASRVDCAVQGLTEVPEKKKRQLKTRSPLYTALKLLIQGRFRRVPVRRAGPSSMAGTFWKQSGRTASIDVCAVMQSGSW